MTTCLLRTQAPDRRAISSQEILYGLALSRPEQGAGVSSQDARPCARLRPGQRVVHVLDEAMVVFEVYETQRQVEDWGRRSGQGC